MIFESVADSARERLVRRYVNPARAGAMQRVPFAALRGLLDRDRVDSLVRRYRLRPALGQMLLRSRIDQPEDILRVPQLGRVATADEMWRLASDPLPPADVLGTDRVLRCELLDSGASGIVSGFLALGKGQRRVFIADANGDLISAELDTDAAIDHASVRLGGYRHFQLAHLATCQLRDLLVRLHSPVAISASLTPAANNGRATAIYAELAELAHVLRVIQSLTAAEAVLARQLTTAATAVDGVALRSGTTDGDPCALAEGIGISVDNIAWQMDVDRCCAAYRARERKARSGRARNACRRGLYESIVRSGAERGWDYTALATLLYVIVSTADKIRRAASLGERRRLLSAAGILVIAGGVALWALWSWR